MIIKEESPLRRLSSQINRDRVFFLDGIRHCIEIIDLLYGRLEITLTEITNSFILKTKKTHYNFVSAFQDAWSLIDSVYRLRGLLRHCPGIKQKASGIFLFYKETIIVDKFRNIFQHLNTEMNRLINEDLPVFGVITWICMYEHKSAYSCGLIAGTLIQRTEHHIINPAGKAISPPIDYITLTAGGYTINLSLIFLTISKLTRFLEDNLKNEFGDLSPEGADLSFCIEFGSDKTE